MKSLALIEYGTPENAFRYQDAADPTAKAGQVVLQVEACALNHLDLWIRQGRPKVPRPLPHILGSDIAGTVVSIGEGVSNVKMGAKYIVQPGISCGNCASCHRGDHNDCDHYSTVGLGISGGYADYICVPAANLAPWPEGLSAAEAVSLPLVLTTTHHMIATKGKIQFGEWVLVQGAASGVGAMAIQVAKAYGGRVICTASSEEKAEFGLSLGAEHALIIDRDNIPERVKMITNGQGVNLAIEHIGETTFADSVNSLAKGGRVVSCGATIPGKYPLDLTKLFWLRQSIVGSRMGRKQDLIDGLKLVAAGKVKGTVAREFTLREGAAAHNFLGGRSALGKVVLIP